jgi:hypothetical protein
VLVTVGFGGCTNQSGPATPSTKLSASPVPSTVKLPPDPVPDSSLLPHLTTFPVLDDKTIKNLAAESRHTGMAGLTALGLDSVDVADTAAETWFSKATGTVRFDH